MIPYFSWNLIKYLYDYGYILFKSPSSFNFKKFIESFVFYQGINSGHSCINGVLWYIVRLLSYMIIAPIIYYICKHKISFIITELILIFIKFYYNQSYSSFAYWLVVFIIGAYVGLNYSEKFSRILCTTHKNKTWCVIFSLIIYVIYVTIFFELNNTYSHYSEFILYVFRLLSVFIISYCVYLLPDLPKAKNIIIHSPFFIYCSQFILLV